MAEEEDVEQATPAGVEQAVDLREAVEAVKKAAAEATDSIRGFADALSPRPPALNRAGRRAAAKAARRKR